MIFKEVMALLGHEGGRVGIVEEEETEN